ncbi:MAG: TetR/AcrR family transcriptional regulator [Planctomycetota bacterium]|jgi:AcrR family transcriptional regulator
MVQQSFEQPGLGDDAPSAPETVVGPGEPASDVSGPDSSAPEGAPAQGAAHGAASSTPTPSAPKPPGPPGKCKGAAKRERILKAATELFAERDFHRVLMDEVAHRAEVGKGTLYRYFKTKEDLFIAVLSFAVDVTTERLRAKLERMDDPRQQLRFACKQALRFFRENDHLFHVLYHRKALGSDRARAELGEKRRGLRHFAEHIIAEGRDSGVFEVDDPGFASTILWGMIRTALRNAPEGGSLDELAGRIVDLFTNGISKR